SITATSHASPGQAVQCLVPFGRGREARLLFATRSQQSTLFSVTRVASFPLRSSASEKTAAPVLPTALVCSRSFRGHSCIAPSLKMTASRLPSGVKARATAPERYRECVERCSPERTSHNTTASAVALRRASVLLSGENAADAPRGATFAKTTRTFPLFTSQSCRWTMSPVVRARRSDCPSGLNCGGSECPSGKVARSFRVDRSHRLLPPGPCETRRPGSSLGAKVKREALPLTARRPSSFPGAASRRMIAFPWAVARSRPFADRARLVVSLRRRGNCFFG